MFLNFKKNIIFEKKYYFFFFIYCVTKIIIFKKTILDMLNEKKNETFVTVVKDFSETKFEKSLSNDSNSSNDTKFIFKYLIEQNEKEISKKTNRGRKEDNPLPNLPKCDICLKYAELSKEKLVSCSICKCLFHKSCYNQYEEISLSDNDVPLYNCIRCSQAFILKIPLNEITCFICGRANKVLNYNQTTRDFYHQICLDFFCEFNGLKKEEISRDFIRKWRYKNSCKYCGEKLSKNVAVIKCKKPTCKDYYHVACAIEKGMIFDLNFMKEYYHVSNNNQIPFFCSNHNKKISREYKKYIMDKFEEKKTFLNQLNSLEIKNIKDNEDIITKIENIDNQNENIDNINELCRSMSCVSLVENNEDNQEQEQNNDILNQNDEPNENQDMDIDNSFDDKNNTFNIDIGISLEDTNDKEDYLYEYNNGHNTNIKNINIDEFCMNKNYGQLINKRNSYNFISVSS